MRDYFAGTGSKLAITYSHEGDQAKGGRAAGKFHKHPRPELVIHGGATGADTLADRVAHELGIPVRVFPADWTRYGRSAGPRRNSEMVAFGPDLVIAFPGDRGTADMVRQARAAGIEVREERAAAPTPSDSAPT